MFEDEDEDTEEDEDKARGEGSQAADTSAEVETVVLLELAPAAGLNTGRRGGGGPMRDGSDDMRGLFPLPAALTVGLEEEHVRRGVDDDEKEEMDGLKGFGRARLSRLSSEPERRGETPAEAAGEKAGRSGNFKSRRAALLLSERRSRGVVERAERDDDCGPPRDKRPEVGPPAQN